MCEGNRQKLQLSKLQINLCPCILSCKQKGGITKLKRKTHSRLLEVLSSLRSKSEGIKMDPTSHSSLGITWCGEEEEVSEGRSEGREGVREGKGRSEGGGVRVRSEGGEGVR